MALLDPKSNKLSPYFRFPEVVISGYNNDDYKDKIIFIIIFIIQIISGYNNNDYEDSFYVIVKHY